MRKRERPYVRTLIDRTDGSRGVFRIGRIRKDEIKIIPSFDQCLQRFRTAARYDHSCSNFSKAKRWRPPDASAPPVTITTLSLGTI